MTYDDPDDPAIGNEIPLFIVVCMYIHMCAFVVPPIRTCSTKWMCTVYAITITIVMQVHN